MPPYIKTKPQNTVQLCTKRIAPEIKKKKEKRQQNGIHLVPKRGLTRENLVVSQKSCFINYNDQSPAAQSMVSAGYWLRSIEGYVVYMCLL